MKIMQRNIEEWGEMIMVTNKFEALAHVTEAIEKLNKMPAFSGTPEQNEILGAIYRNNKQVMGTLLAFEYGKMVAKQEERARIKQRQAESVAVPVDAKALRDIAKILEEVLTLDAPFVFEVRDESGTRKEDKAREFLLEHYVDYAATAIFELVEKGEKSK